MYALSKGRGRRLIFISKDTLSDQVMSSKNYNSKHRHVQQFHFLFICYFLKRLAEDSDQFLTITAL